MGSHIVYISRTTLQKNTPVSNLRKRSIIYMILEKIKKKINKDNSKICGPRKGRLLKSVLVKTSQGKQKSN